MENPPTDPHLIRCAICGHGPEHPRPVRILTDKMRVVCGDCAAFASDLYIDLIAVYDSRKLDALAKALTHYAG